MGEVIYTKFSVNDLVTYTREKSNSEVSSEHIVSSIHTETRVTYKPKSIDSIAVTVKAIKYSFLSFLYGKNREKSSKYGKKSNEYIRQMKMGKKYEDNGVVSAVKYSLEGIVPLIEEEKLTTKKDYNEKPV